jgi:hypothetical protein
LLDSQDADVKGGIGIGKIFVTKHCEVIHVSFFENKIVSLRDGDINGGNCSMNRLIRNLGWGMTRLVKTVDSSSENFMEFCLIIGGQ